MQQKHEGEVMINKSYIVNCYTNKERSEGNCKGIFYEYANGTFKLVLEFDAATERKIYEIYNDYEMPKIINFCCSEGDFFIFEYWILSSGSWTRNDGEKMTACKLKVEFEVFRFGTGRNCFDLSELRIEQATCNFYNLKRWINGFAWHQIEYKEHAKALTKRIANPKCAVRTYEINNGFSIELFIATKSLTPFDVEEQYDICFRIKGGTFEDYNREIYRFIQFMTILCRTPIEIKDKMILSLGEREHINIRSRKWVDEKEADSLKINSYRDLGDNFGNIIKSYYRMMNNEKKRLAIQTLVSDIHETKTIGRSESNFLSVCKAIENLYDDILLPAELASMTEDTEKIVEAIICACATTLTAKQIEGLKKKLDIAYGVTFRKKLKVFFKDSVSFIPKGCNVDHHINLIVNTRNFLTHLGDKEDTIEEGRHGSYFEILYNWLIARLLKNWNNEEKVKLNISVDDLTRQIGSTLLKKGK